MNEKSFYEIIKSYKLTIPNIQRDYVQGRDNYKNKRNLEKFVDTLIDSLVENKPLSLNFVYGYSNGNVFIPIDGQQRLTTLFLLHLFVFSIAKDQDLDKESNIFSNLIYSTRPSSSRFFRELIKSLWSNNSFLKPDFINEKPISKIGVALNIQEYTDENNDLNIFLKNCSFIKANWFRENWLNDLTVRSAILCIYNVKEAFKSKNVNFDDEQTFKNFAELLKGDNCPITFSWLKIPNLNDANDTYVKMNARGKQLTSFENMKVDLFEYLEKNTNSGNENTIDIFKKKIDSEWLVVVLKLILENEDVNSFENNPKEEKLSKIDGYIQTLFHIVVVNRLTLINSSYNPDYDFLKDNNSAYSMNASKICFSEHYLKLGSKKLTFDEFEEVLLDFFDLMELMENEYIIDDISNKEFLANEILKLDSNNPTYPTRILTFAVTMFARNTKNIDDKELRAKRFFEYIRLIRFIVLHSEFNNTEDFEDALKNINSSIGFSDIYAYLESKDSDFVYLEHPFNKEQSIDEVNKAKKRYNNNDWESVIQESEKNPYFCGQSIFLNATKSLNPQKYEEYWKILEDNLIFNDSEGKYVGDFKALYSCYKLLKLDNTKHSDRFTYGYNDSTHHAYDWRGILEEKDYVDDLTKILDEYIKSNKTYKQFVEDKISSKFPSLEEDPNSEDFVRYFLSQNFENAERLFQQGRCIMNNNDYRLLKKIKTSKRISLNIGIAYILFRYCKNYNKKYDDETININFENDTIDFTYPKIKISYNQGKYVVSNENGSEAEFSFKEAIDHLVGIKLL